MASMAWRSSLKDALVNKLKSRAGLGFRQCSSKVGEGVSGVGGYVMSAGKNAPQHSKKGRFFTAAMIGLTIAGGAYVSTLDESTYCGWLFKATRIVNPFFALLDAETAHRLAISAAARGLVPREKRPDPEILGLEVWGRKFSNPLGLAAGFDKNAEAVESNKYLKQYLKQFLN